LGKDGDLQLIRNPGSYRNVSRQRLSGRGVHPEFKSRQGERLGRIYNPVAFVIPAHRGPQSTIARENGWRVLPLRDAPDPHYANIPYSIPYSNSSTRSAPSGVSSLSTANGERPPKLRFASCTQCIAFTCPSRASVAWAMISALRAAPRSSSRRTDTRWQESQRSCGLPPLLL